jgi:DNA-directed RNA polymerase beta' subunit
MTACDQIVGEAKLNKKPRAKKVKPAEELVKKIKFKASDDKLGVTSVPPAQLVGAQGAVVYNTKTRKIGIYTSLNSGGLTVKGTSIGNFTDKSTQKTLRKPELQLRDFKDQNTNRRVEAWFKNIKATEINLNGRLNAETMILKVFK